MDNMSGHVLIVDDEETFRLSTGALLHREGYTCTLAQSGEEALEKITPLTDLLITDIQMPGNAELGFLKRVHELHPNLSIIVVTGFPSVATAIQALHLAVMDYVIKPLAIPEFFENVAQGVQRGRLLRGVHETHQSAAAWYDAMNRLEPSLQWASEAKSSSGVNWTMDRFFSQAIGQMAQLSGGLQRILKMVPHPEQQKNVDICRLIECPRSASYQQVLQETIEVLEKTKRAFKSKDLGVLREKIEHVLEANKHQKNS